MSLFGIGQADDVVQADVVELRQLNEQMHGQLPLASLVTAVLVLQHMQHLAHLDLIHADRGAQLPQSGIVLEVDLLGLPVDHPTLIHIVFHNYDHCFRPAKASFLVELG